jgi:hypothetical protein
MKVTWSVGKRKGKFEKGSMDVLTPLFHGNVRLQAEHQQDFEAQHLNRTILNSSLQLVAYSSWLSLLNMLSCFDWSAPSLSFEFSHFPTYMSP